MGREERSSEPPGGKRRAAEPGIESSSFALLVRDSNVSMHLFLNKGNGEREARRTKLIVAGIQIYLESCATSYEMNPQKQNSRL